MRLTAGLRRPILPNPPPPASPPDRVDSSQSAAVTVRTIGPVLTRRYVVALAMVGVLLLGGFSVMAFVLEQHRPSGAVLNVSGRQRMLSQRIALLAVRLRQAVDFQAKKRIRASLRDAIGLMRRSHEGLTRGSVVLDLPAEMSVAHRRLYFSPPTELDTRVGDYLAAAEKLAASDRGVGESDGASLRYILQHGPGDLLRDLDRAVQLYEIETGQRVSAIQRLQVAVLALALATLFMTGWFFFRPLVRRIQRETNEVLASQRRFESLAQGAPIGIFRADPNGRCVYLNDTWLLMSGQERDDDQSWTVGIHPDDIQRVKHSWRQAAADRAACSLEYRQVKPDGQVLWFEARVVPVVGNDRQLVDFIGTIADVSERKRDERMQADFISNVSHELRTPLTSIRGSLRLIAGGAIGEPSPAVRELVEIADRNCERLVALVADILDVERLEADCLRLHLEKIDLVQLVDETVAESAGYGQPFGVSICVESALTAAPVRADQDRLKQVLHNLLSNAAKYSPEGSTVRVAVEATKSGFRVSVHDRGPGIAPGIQRQVFEKFVHHRGLAAGRGGGAGLGLHIAKSLVDRMGGTIDFRTADGEGTSFFVQLPAA